MATQAFDPAPTRGQPRGHRRAAGRTATAPAGVCGLVDLNALATSVFRHEWAPVALVRRGALAAAAHAGEKFLRVLGGRPDYEAHHVSSDAASADAEPPVVTDVGPVHYAGPTDSPARDGKTDYRVS
jgi:hypothetical protein